MKIEANLERRGQLYEMQMAWVLDMDAPKPFDQNISPWQIPDWNGILQFGWKPGSEPWSQSEPGWERFWEQKDTQFEWNGKQEPLFVYGLVPFLSGHQEACVCVVLLILSHHTGLDLPELRCTPRNWRMRLTKSLPLPFCSPCLSAKSTAARAWHCGTLSWGTLWPHTFLALWWWPPWTECSSLGLILLTSFSYCAVGYSHCFIQAQAVPGEKAWTFQWWSHKAQLRSRKKNWFTLNANFLSLSSVPIIKPDL